MPKCTVFPGITVKFLKLVLPPFIVQAVAGVSKVKVWPAEVVMPVVPLGLVRLPPILTLFAPQARIVWVVVPVRLRLPATCNADANVKVLVFMAVQEILFQVIPLVESVVLRFVIFKVDPVVVTEFASAI